MVDLLPPWPQFGVFLGAVIILGVAPGPGIFYIMATSIAQGTRSGFIAALGIADKLKGQLPIGLIVLKAGVEKDNETISKECIKMVRDKIGPVAAFKVAIVIKRLPKTRSGKILRGTIRKIADNVEYKMPPTIDDPAILSEIKEDLIKNNILKGG